MTSETAKPDGFVLRLQRSFQSEKALRVAQLRRITLSPNSSESQKKEYEAYSEDVAKLLSPDYFGEGIAHWGIVVSTVPPPGVPLLILPLPVFGDNAPTQLKVDLVPKRPTTFLGYTCSNEEAWNLIWAKRLLGYDCEFVTSNLFLGPVMDFAANENQWVHCNTLAVPGDVTIKGHTQRKYVALPAGDPTNGPIKYTEYTVELQPVTVGIEFAPGQVVNLLAVSPPRFY